MVFLFIVSVLSIFHVCVCDLGYSCTAGLAYDPNTIYLIDSNEDNDTIKRLNEKFMDACHEFYNIETINVSDVNTAVNELLEEDLILRNRIILHANLTLKHFNELEKNDTYAGDITDTYCVKTNTTEAKCNCIEIVKLVTKSIKQINSGDLFDFVTKIQIINNEVQTRDSCYSVIETNKELKTVLLCVDEDKDQRDLAVNIEPLKLLVKRTYNCRRILDKFHNNFLAVLAPEPFQAESEISIPTIFYESPYISTEHSTVFPNSMSLFSINMLKYSFVEFLKSIGWNRVVILSDDSEYSFEFENELAALFNAESIMYTVIRCEDAEFNFTKAISSLYTVAARIVIANVNEINADRLIRTRLNIIWLVRHLATPIYQRRVFTFALDSALDHSKDCHLSTRILEGVSSIAHAYRSMNDEDFALSKLQFYSKFTKAMKNIRKAADATAYVKNQNEYVLKMLIDKSGVKVTSFNDPYQNGVKPRDALPCLLRSNKYEEPCHDMLALILMFVIIMFVTTLLLITCYFDKTSPFHDIRYQNF